MASARLLPLAAILLGALSQPALGTVNCDPDEMDLCTDAVDMAHGFMHVSAAAPAAASLMVAAATVLLSTAAASLPSAAAAESGVICGGTTAFCEDSGSMALES
ncbi:unnamed protein product [Prorocentrum cordatum]|uniref:Uncharacterized protein n=1 Tax=Prorocentrum cordatum TaxID=2364126 RepID=A0ABN9XR55_9DINO|nr:unnamed protein product [Polarella glacialis]